MANLTKPQSSRAEKHPDPGKSGDMVTFYLAHQNGMDRGKSYSITVNSNGYPYTAHFGRSNTLPRDIVAVLKDSKSAIHPSANVAQMAALRGGDGRPASELLNSQQRTQYIPDYEIVIEKEN